VRIFHGGRLADEDDASFRPSASPRIEGRLLLGSQGGGWPRWAGTIEAVAIHARPCDAGALAARATASPAELGSLLEASGARFACVFPGEVGKDCRPAWIRPEHVTRLEAPLLGMQWPPGRIRGWVLKDGLLNVLFFVPVGLLVAWRRGWRGVGLALGVGLLLSLGIEIAQAYIPGRDSSLLDVAANSLGAAIGGLLSAWRR